VVVLGGLYGKDITLARGAQILFRGLSFELAAGDVLSVEGPNGAGKTSLLRLIAGFLEQREGSIALKSAAGADIADPEERARFIGWLGHQDGIKPQLTSFDNLRFFTKYLRHGDAEEALGRMGLHRVRDLPVQYLSAGQKKRLALARLMASGRPLWLIDEPLSSLDAQGRSLASELVAEHCKQGGMVVAATHDPLGVPCRRLTLGGA
jgi:heme exporter protein A